MLKKSIATLIFLLFIAVLFILAADSLTAAAPPPTPARRSTPEPTIAPPLSSAYTLPPPQPVSAPVGQVSEIAATGIFGANIRVNTDDSALHHEPAIAVNPLNASQLLASSNNYLNGDNAYFYRSSNAGQTWTQGVVPKANGGYGGGDGWTAYDNFGNGYLVQLVRVPRGIYIGRLRACCGWEPMIALALNTTEAKNDKPFLAVDQTSSTHANRIYVTWTRFDSTGGGTIMLRYADASNYSSWSPEVRVSPVTFKTNQWSYITIGADGAVYVAYTNYGTTNRIVISKSTDGGNTFPVSYILATVRRLNNAGKTQLPGVVTTEGTLYFAVNQGPTLAAHPVDPKKLAAVWMDGYSCTDVMSCTRAHIVASTSTDSGVSWSTPVVVNDDADANGRDHFFPALAAGADGMLHASWYDRRASLNPSNPYLYNEFYSSSITFGLSWAPNQRVSTASSDPANPQYRPGMLFIGDFSGIAVGKDKSVWPIWTDTRNGKQWIYTARGVLSPVGSPTPIRTNTPTKTPTKTATPSRTNTPSLAQSKTPTNTLTSCTQTVQNNNSLISYTGTWNTFSSSSANGGSYAISSQTNATASFTFTGGSVRWFTQKAPPMGIANVVITNSSVNQNIDLYQASSQFTSLLFSGLPAGTHTITIRVTGSKNNAATGSHIVIDAFQACPSTPGPTNTPTNTRTNTPTRVPTNTPTKTPTST